MHSVGGGVLSVFTRTIFQSVFPLAYEAAFTRHPFLSFACACVFFPAVSMTLALWLCLHCNLCRTASNSGVKKGHVSHWLIDWHVTYSKPEVSARVRLFTFFFIYSERLITLDQIRSSSVLSISHSSSFGSGQLLGTAPCFSAWERQIVMESVQGRDLWGGRL